MLCRYFNNAVRGATLRSLGHALGPARGTLCFSAAIITLCDLVRSAAEQMQNSRQDTMPAMILSCICSWILNMLQEIIRYVSTLATIQVPLPPRLRRCLAALVRGSACSLRTKQLCIATGVDAPLRALHRISSATLMPMHVRTACTYRR